MDTQRFNIDTKSQLAKLIATENISVQINNVKTASFDVKNRVLTLPNFKSPSIDVTDMLIAHECSHALNTPSKSWEKINDDELRSYINVLEDCRIDKLIQKKYPGIIKNYINGFDILNGKNFFGVKDKNINKDLMLIDKINLYYKSSKRLPFVFSPDDNKWLAKVDKLKSFKNVVDLAKELLDWQKKEVEKLKKLPDFDKHIFSKLYSKKQDSESNEDSNYDDLEKDSQQASSGKTNPDSKQEQPAVGSQSGKDKTNQNKQGKENKGGSGAGGDVKLKSFTNDMYEFEKEKITDLENGFMYVNLPKPNYKQVMVSTKKFVNDIKSYINDQGSIAYKHRLKQEYNEFKNNQKKTVMYLVKEFEMKKSANSYKRATVNKTGVIDPLKLKNYKFSDDIFKRLTIIPNEKNHGMIMLLDWSGSMHNIIGQTIDQLMNLVWFCQKVNIPFEVYLFSSETDYKEKGIEINGRRLNDKFKYKPGDLVMEDFKLINIANHTLRKTELDEALYCLYHMKLSYQNYSYTQRHIFDAYSCGVPRDYMMGSTPLNEALVVLNDLVPQFKKKFNIEKMTLITLTDGGANSSGLGKLSYGDKGLRLEHNDYKKQLVISQNKKNYKGKSWALTGTLLNILRHKYNINVVGFYITKRTKYYDVSRFLNRNSSGSSTDRELEQIQKQLRTDKCALVEEDGYDRYFLINGKTMNVENADLDNMTSKDLKTVSTIKKYFSKSMKGRITSRVLLNKFIEGVA